MPKVWFTLSLGLVATVLWLLPTDYAAAHHILGRPSYSLNEDSNTPPAMQAEVQIGAYLVTYMVYPAFPRPGAPGRINLYATRLDDGVPFQGEVTFKVRTDSWLSAITGHNHEEKLGSRPPDDNVFRQGFLFHEAGDYIITAEFFAGGEPYTLDFPLRVGAPGPIGPIGITVGLLLVALVGVSIVQRRRALTGKIRDAHKQQDGQSDGT